MTILIAYSFKFSTLKLQASFKNLFSLIKKGALVELLTLPASG